MLIAFAGLPSSGKSSTALALGEIMSVEALLEPEESAWPELVKNKERTGDFTALTWFRTARVPQLFHADDVRNSGGTVIVDSYYDILIARYLGKEAFSWLLARGDPYFHVAEAMVREDWANLPKADVLVFLRLDEQCWLEFMERRNRNFDKAAGLAKHFEMQEIMLSAAEEAASKHNTRLLVIDQRSSAPIDTAHRVHTLIRGET